MGSVSAPEVPAPWRDVKERNRTVGYLGNYILTMLFRRTNLKKD